MPNFEKTLEAIKHNDVDAVNLNHSNLTQQNIKDLSDALETNSSVLSIKLDLCSLNDSDIKTLSPSFKKSKIKHLILSNNKITDRGMTILANNLPASCESLILSGNPFKDIGLRAIVQSPEILHVKKLWLNGIHSKQTGIQSLSTLLSATTTLEELNISGMTFTKKAAMTLFNQLQQNHSLRSLIMQGICKDYKIALIILTALKNTQLEQLDLATNTFGPHQECMIALKELIENDKSLKNLSVANNGINWQTGGILLETVQNSTALRFLDSSQNLIGKDRTIAIDKILSNHLLSDKEPQHQIDDERLRSLSFVY